MNWRPDNWEELLDKAQDNRIGISWLSDHTYRELMEIGADALLEALREGKELHRIIATKEAISLRFPEGLGITVGTWVFIPDEESE